MEKQFNRILLRPNPTHLRRLPWIPLAKNLFYELIAVRTARRVHCVERPIRLVGKAFLSRCIHCAILRGASAFGEDGVTASLQSPHMRDGYGLLRYNLLIGKAAVMLSGRLDIGDTRALGLGKLPALERGTTLWLALRKSRAQYQRRE